MLYVDRGLGAEFSTVPVFWRPAGRRCARSRSSFQRNRRLGWSGIGPFTCRGTENGWPIGATPEQGPVALVVGRGGGEPGEWLDEMASWLGGGIREPHERWPKGRHRDRG